MRYKPACSIGVYDFPGKPYLAGNSTRATVGDRFEVYRFLPMIQFCCQLNTKKIYARHNQKNAYDFVDYVIEKLPFRIREIRTDRGHEFQAKFHWHIEDQGIRHVSIKPRSPQLNGKVERSHRSDQEEFYQLLIYIDDQGLNKKLDVREKFYNFSRPHGAFSGRAPYEIFRERLQKVVDGVSQKGVYTTNPIIFNQYWCHTL